MFTVVPSQTVLDTAFFTIVCPLSLLVVYRVFEMDSLSGVMSVKKDIIIVVISLLLSYVLNEMELSVVTFQVLTRLIDYIIFVFFEFNLN